MKEFYQGKGAANMMPIFKGEVIKGDDTFMKRQVKFCENFILVCGGFEAIKFNRFGRLESGDYFYMSDTYFDAIAFRPKKDVYFLGFGFLNQYEKHAFKLKFKYFVGDVEYPETELDIS